MKQLFFFAVILFTSQKSFTQNYIFTNTGNAHNAPYGDKSWNWDTTRYKHFSYKSPDPDNYVMPYRLLSPPNNDITKKYPLFIMFHGAGEGIGGDCDIAMPDNTCQLIWGGKIALDSINKYPSYVFFPQTGGGYWGNNGAGNAFYGYTDPMAPPTRVVFEIIDNILLQNYNIDPDRIYVAGLSAGGRAAWEFLERRPELFAAATPFSGMGNTYLANTLINNPVWNYQGGMDDNPAPFETQNMYDSLVKYGGNPRRSLYVDRDHWSWVDAYQSKTWLQWLYGQDKKNIHVLFGKNSSICPGDSLTFGIGYGFLQYQWKKDGTDIPGANNYVYTAKVPGSYTVAAQRKNGTFMTSNPLIVGSQNCAVTAQNGLNYSYYEGNYTNLPNFATVSPKKSGFINNYSLVPREKELQYAFKFDGFINITSPGQYTFYTNSDDGSKLLIDGVQIVNNDFLQGPTERSGVVNLTTGKKAISVTYFQGTGGQLLEVRYQGPGIVKQLIPDFALFLTQNGGNVPPLSNAGPDVSQVLPNNSISLSGTGIDADGTIATYLWTKISGPAATITGANTANVSLGNLVAGTYVFRLTVTDNQGASASDDVSIIISSGTNVLPVANAGPDVSISAPANTAILAGSAIDPDGTITAYAWTLVSGPQATLANANTATLSLSTLLSGTYVFRLTVTDNQGATAFDEATLTVKAASNGINYSYYEGNYNNLPNFAALTPVKTGITPNYTLTLRNKETQYAFKFDGFINITTAGQYTFFTSSDDGSKLYINGQQVVNNDFLQGTTERSGKITLATGKQAISVTYFQQGGGQVLEVRYQGPGISKQLIPANVLFTANAPNIAPVANAGADKNLVLPANTLGLAGSATDADGTISTYAWTKVSGPAVTLINANTATVSLSGLVAGSYIFRLTATDNSGALGTDDVIITVNPANQSPVANAGNDVVSSMPVSTLTLVGTGTDPDGSIASYSWTKQSGPSVTLSGTSTASLSLSELVAGVYVFRLTVVDNTGASGQDDVTVTVNPAPNINPVANAGKDTVIGVPLNSLVLTGSGSDADGTIQSYAWTKQSGPSAVLSSVSSPILTISGLNIGTYVFRLTVTDDRGSLGTDDITVTVTVAGNQPPVAFAGADTSVVLPLGTLLLRGNGTDLDGTIQNYLWTKESGPAVSIANENTKNISLTTLQEGTYIFRLTVTDNQGLTGFDEVKLTVMPSNALPVANAGPDASLILPVNTIVLTGSGTDTDGTIAAYSWTKVTGPAAVLGNAGTTKLTLSGLVAGSYTFRLTVTDNKGGTGIDDVVVVVNPAANKPPVANAGPDILITLPVNSAILAGSGADSDGSIASFAWTQQSGPVATLTNAAAATLSLSNLIAGNYVFRLTVTDNSGSSVTDDATVVVNPATKACNFGTPLATALPSVNTTYNKAYVLGQGGPNFSNISSFTINWNLAQKALYTLSLNTSNGVPNYYMDLRTVSTNTFGAVTPSISFSKSGITGLDGSYNVGLSNGNFVMAEKTGKFTIYFSNSTVAPVCAAARLSASEHTLDVKISPNPATQAVTIAIPSGISEANVVFISEYGQSFHMPGIITEAGMDIDISALLPGVYSVMVIQEGRSDIKKLVIIK